MSDEDTSEQSGIRHNAEDAGILRRLKWIAGVIVAMSTIGTAVVFAGDSRWVQKEVMRTQIGYAFDLNRKLTLDDKIYEITLVPETQRTNEQRAVLERSLRQHREISERWQKPPEGN